MHRRAVQTYDFRSEVLPVIVVGILFNLLGRYACVHVLQPFTVWLSHITHIAIIASLGDQVFLDMGGTAYAAIMAGPWWAAAVGVTSNAINGGYYDAYFPFGVVNILGGLAWGYYANVTGMRARIAERSASWTEIAKAYIGFTLIGGIVGGIGSSITHLILYPLLHHPFTHGSAYDLLRSLPFLAGAHSLRLMFAGDLMRDMIDKAIGVFGAFFWILIVPVVPLGLKPPHGPEKYKSDVASIFAFAIIYSLFLTAARFAKPVIQFLPGDVAVEWLHYPLVIAWLYVPIALALGAYLLLSFDSYDPYGRQINAMRAQRRRLYQELSPPTILVFAKNELDIRLIRGRQIYGLVLSVAFWPIGKDLQKVTQLAVYFGVIFFALLAFSLQNRRFVQRYIEARDHIAALHRWMDISAMEPAVEFLRLLAWRVAGGLSESAGKLRAAGRLVYQLVYVPQNPGGGRSGNLSASTGGTVVMVAAVTGPRIIDEAVRADVDQIVESIAPDALHLISLISGADDAGLGAWLASMHRRDIEAGLLCWYDVEDAVAAETRAEAARILIRARMRTLELISGNNRISAAMDKSGTGPDPKALAARALPALAHIMDRLPPNSTVIDLGAGRGRHTLYAMYAGHDVIAVERKEAALKDLHSAIAATGKLAERAVVIHGDYAELVQENYDDADLVISTGALQHAMSHDELHKKLKLIGELASAPGAQAYIEMLFNMRFDGKPADDGRLEIEIAEFEDALRRAFPAPHWRIERAAGPSFLKQDFSAGARSFIPTADKIELTAVEYLLTRQD